MALRRDAEGALPLAVVALTDGGAELARRLAVDLEGVELWLPERLRSAAPARYFSGAVVDLLPQLFRRVRGLICIMATGIVVRALAPVLVHKASDPAVVVIDEAGRFAISLLSGHLGGANDLARQVAAFTGGTAVITTATDVNGLLAWDEAARRAGLVLEPLAHIRTLNTLLLEGKPIDLVDRRRLIAPWFAEHRAVRLQPTFAASQQSDAAGRVFVTHRLIPQPEQQPQLLLLRPRNLVVGIGCNRGTSTEEIEEVVSDVFKRAFLAWASLAVVASIEEKRDETGLTAFAARHRLTLEFHPAAALNRMAAPSPPSLHALAAVGAQGVCEPAALLASGNATLLVPKQKRGNVTVAVAETQCCSGGMT